MGKILERIERQYGAAGLLTTLAERLSAGDLQSLLLEVFRLRSRRRTPAAVLADYMANRFTRPAAVSPQALLSWEQIAFAHLPAGFQSLALAPVAPLGASAAVAGVDQNWSVATARNTEVVSDSTNVLALECAARRRELLLADPHSTLPVHLAASHRLLRAQYFSGPLQTAHFSAFALVSAGRDSGHFAFELAALELHLRFYLGALATYLAANHSSSAAFDPAGSGLRVSLTDISGRSGPVLETRLLPRLAVEFPNAELTFDPERRGGRTYYREACFHIYVRHPVRGWLEIVDGGMVTWSQLLLQSAKERLLISGMGSERLVAEFPPTL